MKINHNNYNLNYYQLIIKIIFLILVTVPSITFANDNKIASVIEISGDAIALTEDGDERELEIFDNLFIEDEIFIGDASSATIQFNDNTTIILKELTSLNIKEFENSEARAVFKLELGKGEIIIESGSISKNKNGEMLVDLSNMSLGVRGTRFNAGITNDGKSKVALQKIVLAMSEKLKYLLKDKKQI